MKKILPLIFPVFFIFNISNSQILNQPANWPNEDWSLSGSYDPVYLYEDPTVNAGSNSFSYDEDDAGGSSINNLAVESPIIDLSSVLTAGETELSVSFQYVLNIFGSEILKLQYWDADTSQWLDWGITLGDNSGATANFCNESGSLFTSEFLNVVTFSNNQQQNFRYRIFYDDNSSWGWGFCVDSPTITSSFPPACPNVSNLTVNNISYDSAQAIWNIGSTEIEWEAAIRLATQSPPTSGTATSDMFFDFSGLTPLTDYVIYVRANCNTDGYSNWSGVSFTTGENLSGYPITFTPNTIPTTESYDNALVDLNGDFLDDVVSVGTNNINIHYQLTSGGFNEVNISTTPANFSPTWSLSAGDFDANGYNDLLYGGGSGVTIMKANDSGTAYTEFSGPEFVFSQRSNFVDINNDGHLDAFVCHDFEANVYYVNDGNGNLTFYQGQSPGVLPNGIGLTPGGGNYGTVWIDFDNDRDIDMFNAKCRGGSTTISTNELWRNDGNGVFVNVADGNNWYNNNYPGVGHNNSSNLGDNVQTWSSAWGDFDNDGDMDVFVGASSSSNGDSKLMRNNGDGTFTDVTSGSGVLATSLGIENAPADFDNDGYVDILSSDEILFNNGDFTFTNYSNNMPESGAIGDANNDGFLDVFRNGVIYMSNTNSNNWVKINTIGNTSNINGIGARVEITTSSGTQIRDVRSGEGFRYMSSLNTHFGLGTDTNILDMTIYWPSGIVDYIPTPAINTTHTIVEGSFLAVEDQSLVDMIIFPNPANDIINIKTSASLIDKIATVFDINGKRVLNEKLTSDTINVSFLDSGIYFLRLESNGKIMKRKFIKK
jgi:hypothetical protein